MQLQQSNRANLENISYTKQLLTSLVYSAVRYREGTKAIRALKRTRKLTSYFLA
jgi:hypothetical protein